MQAKDNKGNVPENSGSPEENTGSQKAMSTERAIGGVSIVLLAWFFTTFGVDTIQAKIAKIDELDNKVAVLENTSETVRSIEEKLDRVIPDIAEIKAKVENLERSE